MTSFKQHGTRSNQLTNKFEVSKPKVGIGLSGLGGTNRTLGGIGRASTTRFKVYSESETFDVKSGNRTSLPVKKSSTVASGSFSKGVLGSTDPGKSKNDASAKQVVERRALADVSNSQRTSLRGPARRSLKPPFSVSTNLGARTVNVLSTKSIQGNVRGDPNQGVSELHISKKAGNKDLKAPSNYQRTTATRLTCESIVTNGRRATNNSRIPTRKSLPVFKRANQVDIPKENFGSESEKGKVKVAVGKKVEPGVTNARTNLWRNRVSDGFVIMRKKNLDSRALPRKSIKIAPKSSVATRNMKSSQTKDSNTSATVATTFSKKKQAVTSSLCENLTQESVHGEVPSISDCKPSTLDVTTKKSSRRRKSYTSLLMEGSKLLEEHGDATKQEKLASIDNEGNQLEVADYVDDIYQYYWVTEAQISHIGNYMSIQTDITPPIRAVLINWLIEVHHKYDLMQETLYLMITLLDQYLSQVTIKKNEMQLVGLTALLLASKYEDFWHPRVQDLLAISAESYTRDQILGMEKLILKQLKFRLNTPTPYVFMLRFLKAAESGMKKLEHLAFYLIELCLVEYEALLFKPSLLCASAIYIARCSLQMTPWTPLLRHHARYEESQLRECAEMVLRFQKAASTSQLKVTYEKYMNPELSGVAGIKPLDKLPL